MIMIREPLPGRYELAKAYDTSDVDRANAEMRKTDPWSPLRGLRRAASIPVEDLRRLSLGGNLDATAALAVGLALLGSVSLVPVAGPLAWSVASLLGIGTALAAAVAARPRSAAF